MYLSDAYAFFFAHQATKGREDLLIIEVDVEDDKLYPDEDYLAQAELLNGRPIKLNERTCEIRDMLHELEQEELESLRDASMRCTGSVSHVGVIKPEQITRMAIVPYSQVAHLIVTEFDPVLGIRNYMIIGHEHRKFQQSLFERFPAKLPKRRKAVMS